MKNVIIIGAGGHGKVVADIVVKSKNNLIGFLDDNASMREFIGYPVLGTTKDIFQYTEHVEFVVAIGNNQIRKQIVQQYSRVTWCTLIHPLAAISIGAKIGEGSVVMPQSMIGAYCTIGKHCILNSGAIVEHDNMISDYVHISPGVVTGGSVHVGEGSHIGLSATVLNNITIASDVILGANCTATKNISKPGIYVGTPARRL